MIGAGDRERGDGLAARAAHGGRHRGEAGLELAHRGGVPAQAHLLADVRRERRSQLGWCGAERCEDLADGRGRVLDPASQPVGAPDEVAAVDLREVLDAERRRHRQVDGLAAGLAERLEDRGGQVDEVGVGHPAAGEPQQDRARPHLAAGAVAREEATALERRDGTGDGALGEAATLRELAHAGGAVALHHEHEELRGTINRLRSGHCVSPRIMKHSFHI